MNQRKATTTAGVSFEIDDVMAIRHISNWLKSKGDPGGRSRAIRLAVRHTYAQLSADTIAAEM